MSEEAQTVRQKYSEKGQENYLNRIGLGRLISTIYSDRETTKKQQELKNFFISHRGRDLVKRYSGKPWLETTKRVIGFESVLTEKLKFLCDAVLSSPTENIDSDKMSRLVLMSIEASPDQFGTTHSSFLDLVLRLEEEKVFSKKEIFDEVLSYLKYFKSVNSPAKDVHGTSEMFSYMFLQRYVESLLSGKGFGLEKMEKFSKINVWSLMTKLFGELFNKAEFQDGQVGQYVNLFAAVFHLTDGDNAQMEKLMHLCNKKDKGVEAIQMLEYLSPDMFYFLSEVLMFAPKIFFKYLFLFARLRILQKAGLLPQDILSKFSSPKSKISDFSPESRGLPSFSTHGKLLERRGLQNYPSTSDAFKNLTREFSGVYFNEIFSALESKVDTKFVDFSERILSKNPNLSLEDLIKFEFMYEKYQSAYENKTYPYPNKNDLETARNMLDMVLKGESNFKNNDRNKEWAKAVFGSKANEWAASAETRQFEIKNPITGMSEVVVIEKENNTANILLLGEKVNGSCYSPEGKNFWMSFVQAADINRSTYYIKKEDGTILARFISVVNKEGQIVFMPLYYSDSNFDLQRVQTQFATELSRKYNLVLSSKMINVDRIHFSTFVSDRPVDFVVIESVFQKIKARLSRAVSRLKR